MKKQNFYVGWHQPVDGKSGCAKFPATIISVNRLISRKKIYFPVNRWIMDSGAFTRISSKKGHLSVEKYTAIVKKFQHNGCLEAVVCQDYMCEDFILRCTGKSKKEHQILTIKNYDNLIKEFERQNIEKYIMPVLQGYEPLDYIEHIRMYGDRIHQGQWVGVGSICKRNANASSIESVLLAIKSERPDLRLHGFGLKKTALESSNNWAMLYSADSQAATLYFGKGKNKYAGGNNPETALKYLDLINPPEQLSLFQAYD